MHVRPVRSVAVEVPAPADRPAPPRRLAAAIERAAVWARPHLPRVHLLMGVAFFGLIVGPALLPDRPWAHAAAHAANWLIWGLWFPLVFISVLLAARAWCGMLCPMGAASEWANRHGLKRPVPGWLRWEGTPIVSFVIVTVIGQTVGVRDYADAILLVFGNVFLAAVVLGFFYGAGKDKRPWCRHACPIGLLLGVFSRLGVMDLTPKRPRLDGEGYTERGLCPTMIDLKRKTESRHCIMCARCVHPGQDGGLALRLRAPGREVADIHRHHASASEVWFLFTGTGIALGGFLWLVLPQYQALRQALGMWAIERGWTWIGESGPSWLMVVHPEAREVFVWLDFLMIVGWMLAVMAALTAALVALTAAGAWLAGRLGADPGFADRFVRLGYAIAPAAMISLLLGLGGELFALLPGGLGGPVKAALVVAAAVWGVALGRRILAGMGLSGWRVGAALLPGAAAGAMVAAAWWPAVVGL